MCHIVPEGVVLGADSTASFEFDHGNHYFNHNQKLFEIGENSTLGLLTWGLGSCGTTSYRTLLAYVADDLIANPAGSVQDVAQRWANRLWQEYSAAFSNEIARVAALTLKPSHDPNNPASRTEAEEAELTKLTGGLYAGFCIAGHVAPDRTPRAYQVQVFPHLQAAPVPTPLGNTAFWGAPNLILRLMNGYDMELRNGLLNSGKWQGTPQELDTVLAAGALRVPLLPIRDAVDFVYTCIHSTIKALKFSSLNQICGGPIELAVITTDRRFRWVRHKNWDAAILEGDI